MFDQPLYGAVPPVIGGGDPLGTSPVNEMLYRSTFPGINNEVRFIRVYSAICWMVGVITETARQQKPDSLVELSNRGLEKIQLLLSWYNWGQGVRPLAGNGRVFQKDNVSYELRFHSIIDNNARLALERDPDAVINEGAHFLQPAQYRPGLFNGFAFIRESESVPGTYLLNEGGFELAKAYETAIAEHPLHDWLADLGLNHASYEDVQKMADMLDLLNPSSAEQEAFLKHYYPAADYALPLPNWRNRHAGLTLALRAVQAETAKSGSPASVMAIRHTMARGVTRQGVPVDLSNLESVHGVWSSLQFRQVFRKAMDILVRCTESWIKDAEIAQRQREIVDCAESLGASLERALPVEHRSSVSDTIAMYEQLRGAHPSMSAAATSVPELRLEVLRERLIQIEQFTPGSEEEPEAFRAAYYTLIFCMLEVESLSANPYFLLHHKGSEDLPLEPFCKVLREFTDRSPAELMAHVIHYYVISQHFKVIRRRTRDFNNRFRFMPGENGLERGLHVGDLYRPFELQDLLEHALYLLAQCGMVEMHEGLNFTITEAGNERLATYQPPLSKKELAEQNLAEPA
jgi:hypothetical protein